ncbi:MAG TPA: hypothetical protein VLH10_25920 [Yinghuangia sp.]|nr:hypothetical protein [Yinghuangia sp.]
MRLQFLTWENQRRYAEAVTRAERYAEEQIEAARARGRPDSELEASRRALFNAYIDETPGVHKEDAHYFLKFRKVARVLLEAETRAFARLGHRSEQVGLSQAWGEAVRAMVEYARGQGVTEALIAELQQQRAARRYTPVDTVPSGHGPVPKAKIEAAAEAARAFDEAVGDDARAGEIADFARAQAQYAERRPAVRAGDVEVYVYKHPVDPSRQIVARHADGVETELVEAHRPNIVFPRVYPDGFWLEPTQGRHLVYSSQASGDESGAMLTVVDTRTAKAVATIKGADYPDVAWLDPTTFVWVGGSGRQHGAWRVDLATGTRERLRTRDIASWDPTFARAVVGGRYDASGARNPWVAVSENRGPNGSANELNMIAVEGPARETRLLTYADATLASTLAVDNRLIVVSWSKEHPRGRIAEVPVDLTRSHIPPQEWRVLVPDDGRSVVREVVPVTRGPGRDPLLAISRTIRGNAEVHLFDPTTATGTTLPLRDLGLPAVHTPEGELEPGVFGQITGMTATTAPDGTSALEIEHSSVVSSPRTFRFPVTGSRAGPAEEVAREQSIADIVVAGAKVTRYDFPSPDNTENGGVLVEHADAPGTGLLVFTSYQNYYVGNNTSRQANHVLSTAYALGNRLWFCEGRGTANKGYKNFLDGVKENQFGAVMDVVANADFVVGHGIAKPGDVYASAQSAGPAIMLRAVAQRPGVFCGAGFRRPVHDPWQLLERPSEFAHEFLASIADVLSSWHYVDPGIDMPPLSIVIGAPDDPRIASHAEHDLAWRLMTTLTRTLLHTATPGNGHFADEQEAAQELTAVSRLLGHPPPSQTRPHILEDIRSIRPTLMWGPGKDVLPPRLRPSRPAKRAAGATPNQPAVSAFTPGVNRAAGSGLRSAADLVGRGKPATGLPEHTPNTNRGRPVHLVPDTPFAPKPAPKYPALRLELKQGRNLGNL